MRETTYEDGEGRLWRVRLPDGVPDEMAEQGVRIGPPPLTSLRLPLEAEVRLHNQLYHRRILTERDARGRLPDIVSAIMATFKIDAGRIAALYAEGDAAGYTAAQGKDQDKP